MHVGSVWPDLAIFGRSWGQICLQKLPKHFQYFGATLKNVNFNQISCGYFWASFDKFGYFLFLYLVTLPVINFLHNYTWTHLLKLDFAADFMHKEKILFYNKFALPSAEFLDGVNCQPAQCSSSKCNVFSLQLQHTAVLVRDGSELLLQWFS